MDNKNTHALPSDASGASRLTELEAQYGGPALVVVPGTKGTLKVAANQPLMAALFAEETLILREPQLGSFFSYGEETGVWTAITDDSLLMKLDQLVLRLARDACLPHLETSRLRKRSLLGDLVSLLKGLVEQRDIFETRLPLIVTANGVLRPDDNGFAFTEHHPAYYARHASPISYEPSEGCPQFEAFLNHCLPDVADRRLVQAVAGMWLLGHNLTQSIVLFHGKGQTGKSTLLAILRGLIGRHNCSELRTAHLGGRFEMFNYLNKSLLIGSDVPGDFLCKDGAEALKKLTGEDLISVEKKYGDTVEMVASLNVGITSNSKLRVKLQDDAEAWRRRLVIVEFTAPKPAKPEPRLGQRLLVEEGSGILNWALGGVYTLIEEDWRLPLASKHKLSVEDLLEASDSLGSFLRHALESSDDSDLSTEELCSAYRDYCQLRGWEPIASVERQMKSAVEEQLGISQSHDLKRGNSTCRGFRGLRIKGGSSHA